MDLSWTRWSLKQFPLVAKSDEIQGLEPEQCPVAGGKSTEHTFCARIQSAFSLWLLLIMAGEGKRASGYQFSERAGCGVGGGEDDVSGWFNVYALRGERRRGSEGEGTALHTLQFTPSLYTFAALSPKLRTLHRGVLGALYIQWP